MANNLITLAEYKAYIGISSTNQDTVINTLIPQVSALVKNICSRTFLDYVDEFKVEISKGSPTNRIILQETPILQVSSVEFSEDYGKTYNTLTEYTDYVVDQDADVVEIIATPYFDYIKTNAYRISYTAGYETLPSDLKLAVADLVNYYVRNDSAIHSQKAVGANTVQIEYITTTNLPAHIKRVLDQYTAFYG
jgi:uncharacterized phiE125 gp8 family phage protein